jgi:hypothetical protein
LHNTDIIGHLYDIQRFLQHNPSDRSIDSVTPL